MNEIVLTTIVCRRCGLEKTPNKTETHLCDDCVKAENNRVSFFRNHNYNWMDVAKEADLNLWERQPGETDHEYNVWLHYRDAYPGKKPTFRGVAEEICTSVAAVRKIAARWTFPTRMQAWAKFIDDQILEQRREEIISMNAQHVDMAQRLNQKLSKAIDMIDPTMLGPKDINALFKTAAELERKARLDKVPDSAMVVVEDGNPELKKTDVKSSDLQEILKILGGAGVLNKDQVGIRQTVTTEVVVKDDE